MHPNSTPRPARRFSRRSSPHYPRWVGVGVGALAMASACGGSSQEFPSETGSELATGEAGAATEAASAGRDAGSPLPVPEAQLSGGAPGPYESLNPTDPPPPPLPTSVPPTFLGGAGGQKSVVAGAGGTSPNVPDPTGAGTTGFTAGAGGTGGAAAAGSAGAGIAGTIDPESANPAGGASVSFVAGAGGADD